MKNMISIGVAASLLLVCQMAASAAQPERQEMNTGSNTIERKSYDALPSAMGPYSHAVRHGRNLYISGLTAYGSKAQGKSMAEQAKAIFDQIKAVAHAEGTDLKSVIKVTIFITDFSQVKELREELFRQYDGHLPASSLVEVAKLFSPDVNIEIEAVLGL